MIYDLNTSYRLLGGGGAGARPTDPDPESCLEAMGRRGALDVKYCYILHIILMQGTCL